MNAATIPVVPLKKSAYRSLESPDDLARVLLAYFATFAAEAGISQAPPDTPIIISPWTASKLKSVRYIFSDPVGGVRHDIWRIPMAFWMGVDEAGNAFSFGSEGWATHLTFKNLRTRGVEELMSMLDDCDPFGS